MSTLKSGFEVIFITPQSRRHYVFCVRRPVEYGQLGEKD